VLKKSAAALSQNFQVIVESLAPLGLVNLVFTHTTVSDALELKRLNSPGLRPERVVDAHNHTTSRGYGLKMVLYLDPMPWKFRPPGPLEKENAALRTVIAQLREQLRTKQTAVGGLELALRERTERTTH